MRGVGKTRITAMYEMWRTSKDWDNESKALLSLAFTNSFGESLEDYNWEEFKKHVSREVFLREVMDLNDFQIKAYKNKSYDECIKEYING